MCFLAQLSNVIMSFLVLDVDECADSSHDCDVNADCTNTHGSYNCTCKPGYTGDGKTCVKSHRKFHAHKLTLLVFYAKEFVLEV